MDGGDSSARVCSDIIALPSFTFIFYIFVVKISVFWTTQWWLKERVQYIDLLEEFWVHLCQATTQIPRCILSIVGVLKNREIGILVCGICRPSMQLSLSELRNISKRKNFYVCSLQDEMS